MVRNGPRRIALVGLVIVQLLTTGPRLGWAAPAQSLATILTDDSLWGRQFAAALAFLPSWARINERRVAVFSSRVVGGTPHPSLRAAEAQRRRLAEAMAARQPTPMPEFTNLLQPWLSRAAPFRAQAIAFTEDDSFRVAWVGSGLSFLAPGLTVQTVQGRLGPPERVTRVLVQTQKDHRPVILTLYQYAGGALAFAESDVSPRRGTIDRVILDVAAVQKVVFR